MMFVFPGDKLRRMSKKESIVWKHFNRTNEQATCKHCEKTYTCKGGTTSALINHMKMEEDKAASKNPASKKRCPDEPTTGKPEPKQMKLTDCIPESQENLNKAIDDAIVDFLADAGVAFRVVGLESFDRLMKIANRRKKLKHSITYSR